MSSDGDHGPAFFRILPPEIRNRIYEEVLANRTIHIWTRGCPYDERGARHVPEHRQCDFHRGDITLKFLSIVCQAKKSHRRVYERSRACDESKCGRRALAKSHDRHRRCLNIMENFKAMWDVADGRMGTRRIGGEYNRRYPSGIGEREDLYQAERPDYEKERRFLTRELGHAFLNLSLLRVCRQMHQEVSLMPYACNTFAFGDYDDFVAFVDHLSTEQRKAMKSLQIHTWGQSIRDLQPSTVLSLENLTTLEMTLDHIGELEMESPAVVAFLGMGYEHVRVLIEYSFRKSRERRPCSERCRAARRWEEEFERRIKENTGVRDEVKRLKQANGGRIEVEDLKLLAPDLPSLSQWEMELVMELKFEGWFEDDSSIEEEDDDLDED